MAENPNSNPSGNPGSNPGSGPNAASNLSPSSGARASFIPEKKIRLIIADDHSMVRGAFERMLGVQAGIEVLGAYATADEAVDNALKLKPDVVMLDIDMPGITAFEAARIIKARVEGAKIIFLSGFTHDRYIEAALSAGAVGYVSKNSQPEVAVQAVRDAAAGKLAFSADVRARLVIDTKGVRLGDGGDGRAAKLTVRELEVLRYLAQGLAKKEIADVMHLSVKTVENHTTNIMDALDIHDRVALTRWAIREGLVEA